MIRFRIYNFEKIQILKELIDEFLAPDMYTVERIGSYPDASAPGQDDPYDPSDTVIDINTAGSPDKDEIKREIFTKLKELTGSAPEWGILTGVRPVKLAGESYVSCSRNELTDRFRREYFLSDAKAELITSIYEYQLSHAGAAPEGSVGLYLGIPFCPTRCLYCSFASNQQPESEIDRYLEALHKEIEYCGRKLRETGQYPESVYFGGGTPTTLTSSQMSELLDVFRDNIDLSRTREFCIEAGRPDTIDREKLRVIKDHGVSRISINPQSMKQRTLELIGRDHSPEDIVRAFEDAAAVGFDVINCDLIAGLPEESPEDFSDTLSKVLDLGANNITIHTLAVKRASRLKDVDSMYHYKVADTVGKMLGDARQVMAENDFIPYYLYRQKHMAGGHENTGYCLEGKENLYNIRIMDEHQSILALGAGGISKLYHPATNRLERVANVTNYREYIDRIDEMLERKEKGFFVPTDRAV